MKLTDAACCACGRRTVLTVSFLGPVELVIRVPCCDGCQANMTADVRAQVVLAARERAGLPPLVAN